ncbi:MAG: WD40 repeat domain-containing protein [Ktedonobacteraceae bacterium]|nr:WD40 repeat domain-containing protein [Ktedonobacteraceae bacterium]
MFHTDQPSTHQNVQSMGAPRRIVSRRRLLVGLAGSGAVLLLGSPAISATIKNVQRFLTTRSLNLAHASDATAVWSDDLEYVAVPNDITSPTRLDVWGYEQERVISTIPFGKSDSEAYAWSPDNQHLIVMIGHLSDKASRFTNLTCWNVQARRPLYSARGDFDLSQGTPCWSPDGEKLAVFYRGKLFVVNTTNGQTLYTQDFNASTSDSFNAIAALTWSPDSKQIALLIEQSDPNKPSETDACFVVIWDVTNQRQIRQLRKLTQKKIFDGVLAWSPAGDYVATILNQRLQLLHVNDSHHNIILPKTFDGPNHLLAWSPDGRHLAVEDNGRISIWDSETKEQVRTLYRGDVTFFDIYRLAWPRDGQEVVFISAFDDLNLVHYTW